MSILYCRARHPQRRFRFFTLKANDKPVRRNFRRLAVKGSFRIVQHDHTVRWLYQLQRFQHAAISKTTVDIDHIPVSRWCCVCELFAGVPRVLTKYSILFFPFVGTVLFAANGCAYVVWKPAIFDMRKVCLDVLFYIFEPFTTEQNDNDYSSTEKNEYE